jgi:multiple sugar transport system permease protein
MIHFNWLNSFTAVIVPGIPSIFAAFFIRQHIMTLPISLDESAIIDGANHGQIFLYIIMPLCKSALLAIGIVGLVSTWNDFLWPLIVINDEHKYTLSIAVANLQGQYLTRDNHIMASVLLVSVPVIVIFIITQRYFLKGIALSGLKE